MEVHSFITCSIWGFLLSARAATMNTRLVIMFSSAICVNWAHVYIVYFMYLSDFGLKPLS